MEVALQYISLDREPENKNKSMLVTQLRNKLVPK